MFNNYNQQLRASAPCIYLPKELYNSTESTTYLHTCIAYERALTKCSADPAALSLSKLQKLVDIYIKSDKTILIFPSLDPTHATLNVLLQTVKITKQISTVTIKTEERLDALTIKMLEVLLARDNAYSAKRKQYATNHKHFCNHALVTHYSPELECVPTRKGFCHASELASYAEVLYVSRGHKKLYQAAFLTATTAGLDWHEATVLASILYQLDPAYHMEVLDCLLSASLNELTAIETILPLISGIEAKLQYIQSCTSKTIEDYLLDYNTFVYDRVSPSLSVLPRHFLYGDCYDYVSTQTEALCLANIFIDELTPRKLIHLTAHLMNNNPIEDFIL